MPCRRHWIAHVVQRIDEEDEVVVATRKGARIGDFELHPVGNNTQSTYIETDRTQTKTPGRCLRPRAHRRRVTAPSRCGHPVPLKYNHWYDILVHVKWDYTSSGLVEYWLDGAKAVTYNGPTLFWFADNNPNFAGASAGPGQTYWMEGYYRGSGSSTESVYHDAAEIGPTLASVS